jgi:hypothetical protein
MAFEHGAFGRKLGLAEIIRTRPMMSVLVRTDIQKFARSLSLSPCTYMKERPCKKVTSQEESPHKESESSSTLILDPQPLNLSEINV